jgi:hypothetical protein
MLKRCFMAGLLVVFLVACASSPAPQPSLTAANISNPLPVQSPTLPATPTTRPTSTATATFTPAPPTSTPIPQDVGPANFPSDVDPLTGLTVGNPALLERRPLAVKIQMFPRGQRPPWGLSQADIVFDYYQNDGLTRLHAIFYGNDAEVVGPIRSARLLDNRLVRMYRSIFAFGGADQRILNVLFNSEFSDRLIVQGSSSPLYREDPNGANYLLVSTQKMAEYINSKGVSNTRQNLDGMRFERQPPAGGQAADQVYVRYSISAYNRWDYDPTTGSYLRFVDTQEDTGQGEAYTQLIDRQNNQPISAENVVVVYVVHDDYLKNGKYNIVDILMDMSGPAFIFRDGQAYEVRWQRPQLESVLTLTDLNGNPFPFKQGNTWFQVIGQSSKWGHDSGVWRFESRIP